jgi:hypothetical protein
MWPNLFVVGAARAGTASLWRYLDHHPDVYMSREKEPNFFSGVREPLGRSRLVERYYLRLFAAGEGFRYRGEASVSYLCSERATRLIAEVSPDARIVISLRDPVDRVVSAHAFRLMHARETRSLEQVLDDEVNGGEVVFFEDRYTPNVARWQDAFPGGVQVLFFEELVDDVRGQMRELFRSLGLDEHPAETIDPGRHNRGGIPRNRLAQVLLSSRPVHLAGRVFVPERLRSGAVKSLFVKRGSQPLPSPETVARMTDLYRDDVAALEQLLGRPAPWERFR